MACIYICILYIYNGLETFIIGGVHVRVKNRAPPHRVAKTVEARGGRLQSTRNLYNILPQRSQYYYYCCKFIYSTRPADHRPAGTICSGVGYNGRGYGPLYIGMWVFIHYQTRHLYYVCASISTCGLNAERPGENVVCESDW